MKILCSFILFLIIGTNTCFGQDITGKWHGQADFGAMKLRLIFTFVKSGDTYTGTMLSPDQASPEIPITTVTLNNNELNVNITSIGFSYKGKLSQEGMIDGSFSQMGATFPLKLSREEIVINRPQEPKAPYPYKVEEITFYNKKANVKLAGTLTIPEKGTGFPAVVLVTGSGPQNRNEEILGHKPFLVIADYLTRQGIAVLRYDERGVGESGGNYIASNISDFAEDAAVAIGYLETRKEIDPNKIGVAGHSEGGAVAIILASKNIPSFIISLAGPGTDGREIMRTQREAISRLSGIPDSAIVQNNKLLSQIEDAVLTPATETETYKSRIETIVSGTPLAEQAETLTAQMTKPAMISLLRYNPADYFKNVKCPVLALNGEKDVQVISKPSLEGFKQIMANGNKDVTIREYPRLNHLFQTSTTGLPNEYGQIEETFSPDVLNDMAEWILSLFASAKL
jgi:pimeloyl-ACP methyl ester carboxylesterase